MSETVCTIEVWSDVACPFCYLGQKRLDQVLEESGARDRVRVEWKSFLLNPEQKTDKDIRLADYLAREKGWDPAQIRQINDRIQQSGEALGIDFRFEKVVVANTRRAHRLLQYARRAGKQHETGEQLFKAYFTDGENVDDSTVLVRIAKAVGLDVEGLEKMLSGSDWSEAVQSDVEEAAALGVRGVPFFVFNRQFAVSGAQEPEIFRQALEKAGI